MTVGLSVKPELHHNAVRGRPSNGHRQRARKIGLR